MKYENNDPKCLIVNVNEDEDLFKKNGNKVFVISTSNSDPSPSTQMNVKRQAFNVSQFNKTYDPISSERGQKWNKVKSNLTSSCCSNDTFKNGIKRIFPILDWLPNYDYKSHFLADLIVGFTIAIFVVPQSMGYCLIAQVPPVYGLYSSFFPALMYVLLGTSKHSSVGPYAIVSGVMTGNVIHKVQAELESARNAGTDIVASNIEIALMVAIIVGLILTILGIFRFGFISNYLSEQLISGFCTSASIYVFTSQMRNMTGLDLPNESGIFSMLQTYVHIAESIKSVNVASIIISIITIAILLLFKLYINGKLTKATKIATPFPIELLVVIGGTLASQYMQLSKNYGVKIVGQIPSGFPLPQMPRWDLFGYVFWKCIPVTIVGYTITLSVGKTYGGKHGYKVDANQEMLAMGVTNIWSSVWQCMPAAASLTRSAIQDTAGGKTQVVGLINCICMVAVILKLGSYLEQLPKCILGACIAIALISLLKKIQELHRYWKVSKLDGSIWLVVFVSVVVLDVDYGIYTGLAYSLAVLIWKSQRPETYLLGCVDIENNSDVYVPIKKFRCAKEISGIKIYQFCGPLHFANVQFFTSSMAQKCGVNVNAIKDLSSKKCKNLKMSSCTRETPSHIIIDCSMFSHIDTNGVTTLKKTVQLYNEVGVTILLAGCPVHITQMLEKDGFFNQVSFSHSYISVHDAVISILQNINAVHSNSVS